MSQTSSIEWTDATWNPVRGCTKVSPGCAHCYAETFAERWRGVKGHPYEQGFDLRLVPEKLTEPLTWRKPRRVFVNSMSDLFQDGVPDSFIDQVFAVMALAPQHTFQLLTKRAARMRDYLSHADVFARVSELAMSFQYAGNFEDEVEFDARDAHEQMAAFWPLPNVWLGVSVEDQPRADERIPLLLETPAAVRFISAEPLLGPIRLKQQTPDGYWPPNAPQPDVAWLRHKDWPDDFQYWTTGLDWVIVGGESGPGARAMDLAWVRGIVEQCRAALVPVFVKQLGALPYEYVWPRTDYPGDLRAFTTSYPKLDAISRSQGGRMVNTIANQQVLSRKGGDMAEWPEDLRVREFPR